jgi:hypothetical protein
LRTCAVFLRTHYQVGLEWIVGHHKLAKFF